MGPKPICHWRSMAVKTIFCPSYNIIKLNQQNNYTGYFNLRNKGILKYLIWTFHTFENYYYYTIVQFSNIESSIVIILLSNVFIISKYEEILF